MKLLNRIFSSLYMKPLGRFIELMDRRYEQRFESRMEYLYESSVAPPEYERALSDWYLKKTGCRPDLEHPAAFGEKIQWLKLNDNSPEKTILADKYLVREYVKERIGEQYLIPLLGVYDSFSEIDIDALPRRFVMKANHGSHMNIIVDDKENFQRETAESKFRHWLTTNYAFCNGFELQYKNIKPRIVVEENIAEKGKPLRDYKIWCMDGKPTYIFVITRNKTRRPSMSFYDPMWELQPFVNSDHHERCTEAIPRPKGLEEMLSIAEKLSTGFKFVRVDLYDTPLGVKFGEMTFTPNSGIMQWNPPEYAKICGDLIHLPCDRG